MKLRSVCGIRAFSVAITTTIFGAGIFHETVAQTPLYKDPDAPVEKRVEDLLERMTLEEKVAQMLSLWDGKPAILDANNDLDAQKMAQRFPHGLGTFARPGDTQGPASPREVPWRDTRDTVKLVNAVQKNALESTRLGIPVFFHEEGLHGYAAVGATSFPQAIALASTWDPDLIEEINAVVAREIRARGVQVVLSPVVDIARDPRWGRIEETFGEDPYLVSRMGVAAVLGLQGPADAQTLPDAKVYATLKHMTGHGQPESGTNVGPAPISRRTLREYFFPPFESAVTTAGVKMVMASYNEIDGVPSHVNQWLLTDVLRGEWGFDGLVVADYYAINQLVDLHHITDSMEEAAIRSLSAGVDIDLPNGGAFPFLVDAVKSGAVTEERIDAAVARILDLKFRAGMFEKPFADAQAAESITNNAEAIELARVAAEKSVILLKNNGVLPLSLGNEKQVISVIGPNADVARLGGYYGIPPKTVSLLEGIREQVADKADIRFAPGVVITENDDWWADEVTLGDPDENRKMIAEAVETAKGSDVIVLAIGDTEQTSREGWADSHLGDRSSLDLVGEQQELFDALRELDIPMVVVLINGRPTSAVKVTEQADALLEAWYVGEQGGTALANILFGDVNPGGKLPLTIPREVGQIPVYYNHKPSARRGYLFASTDPLFPFGYGLSYTTFDMSAPKLSAASIAPGEGATVQVDVTNTGDRAGDETVQIYVRDKIASVTRPVKQLAGFQRVSLDPGESTTVTIDLPADALSLWNIDMERVVEPGEFDIMSGPNSADLKTTTLTVTSP